MPRSGLTRAGEGTPGGADYLAFRPPGRQRLITLPAATTATITVAAATTAATAAAAAFFARPGFVDRERAAFQIFACHALYGRLRPFRGGHSDKGKAARAAGGTVGHEVDLTYRAEGDESVLQIVFCDLEGQVPHE